MRIGLMSSTAFAAALLAGSQQTAHGQAFIQGDLVVSGSTYVGTAAPLAVGSALPNSTGVAAVAGGSYPNVFNNASVDPNFGVTSPIFLRQYSLAGTTGAVLNSAATINITSTGATAVTTSFPSKSELAINLSADGHSLTFIGYSAPSGQLDVSNSNTPGVIDPTNTDIQTPTYRAVVQLDASGNDTVTQVNAYSGNNGRAAILASNGSIYTVGNAGNGGTPQPAGVIAGAGSQIVTPGGPASTTIPGSPQNNTAEDGSFSVTQINPLTGQPYATTADKAGKDNNFRGETIFKNTLYVTKGSGGNGINTVYQVGTAGNLPTASNTAITILPGFNTILAKTNSAFTPFGLFFANASTLYVSDEGDGTIADAGTDPLAGLEKWSLVNGIWQLDYVLQKNLELGVAYTPTNYPSVETDGIRNITGKVNADGTVSLFGVTSTVSTGGDQGADPNELVGITDNLAATTLDPTEQFTILQAAVSGTVLRGVAFAPVPEPRSFAILAGGITAFAFLRRRGRRLI